jgi:hypothetical protein
VTALAISPPKCPIGSEDLRSVGQILHYFHPGCFCLVYALSSMIEEECDTVSPTIRGFFINPTLTCHD